MAAQHYDKPFDLFHLSETNHDGKEFFPRPLTKERAMEGENWWTKRICVSKSIDGAVSALADSMSWSYGLQFYVHIPSNLEDLFKRNKVFKPTVKQVPDSEVTEEFWLKDKTIWKCIGKIEIGFPMHEGLYYDYFGEKTRLDRFNWKWIEQVSKL